MLQVELELEAALRGADPKPEYELVDEEETEWDEVPDGAGADGEAPADRGWARRPRPNGGVLGRDAALPSLHRAQSAASDRGGGRDAERAEREAAEATAAAAEREAAGAGGGGREAQQAAAEAQQAAAAEAQQARDASTRSGCARNSRRSLAKRADLDKLRTNPAMKNPTLAARMQPKIAEREAEAALTAEVAALQRAARVSVLTYT